MNQQKRDKKGRFLPKVQKKPYVARLSKNERQLFRELNLDNTSFALGYTFARILSNSTDPNYLRIKNNLQLLSLLTSLFLEDDFLRGLLMGAGIENLPDSIDRLSPKFHELSDNLRAFQEKPKKWTK